MNPTPTNPLDERFATIAAKFKSGNDVPVERATILASEWEIVLATVRLAARDAAERQREADLKFVAHGHVYNALAKAPLVTDETEEG